jgi:hypothetical protein
VTGAANHGVACCLLLHRCAVRELGWSRVRPRQFTLRQFIPSHSRVG